MVKKNKKMQKQISIDSGHIDLIDILAEKLGKFKFSQFVGRMIEDNLLEYIGNNFDITPEEITSIRAEFLTKEDSE